MRSGSRRDGKHSLDIEIREGGDAGDVVNWASGSIAGCDVKVLKL